MKTFVKGMQVTNIQIKKECREMHGKISAFDIAIDIIRRRYLECMEADCNKDATFNICLTVDRDTK